MNIRFAAGLLLVALAVAVGKAAIAQTGSLPPVTIDRCAPIIHSSTQVAPSLNPSRPASPSRLSRLPDKSDKLLMDCAACNHSRSGLAQAANFLGRAKC